MSDIWFEENLEPDLSELAYATKGDPDATRKFLKLSSPLRMNFPRSRALTSTEINHIAVPVTHCKYTLVKLGCEFDPGPAARAARLHFDSAVFQVFILANGNEKPRVYNLAPVEFDKGEPGNVKLKLEPSITLISGAGGSLGGIETDIAVGQVAPVVRGFKGKDDMQPYWNLESHKEYPLYGSRNFWLILEAPASVQECYLSCRVEGTLNTPLGRILMLPPQREVEHRPRYKLEFSK